MKVSVTSSPLAADDYGWTDVLHPDEHPLRSGRPAYGRRFFQPVGAERVWLLSFLTACAAMWLSLPFADNGPSLASSDLFWV